MANLYPTFSIPPIQDAGIVKNEAKKSAYFDYVNGDFTIGIDGKIKESDQTDTWIQWCIKTVLTTRYRCLAYNTDAGIEIVEKNNLDDAIISDLQRQITEAIMADPTKRTTYVDNFNFEKEKDSLYVSFTVHSPSDIQEIQVIL